MNTDEYNNGFLTGERVFCTQATNGLPIKTAGRIIPKPPGCYPTNMVRIYFDPQIRSLSDPVQDSARLYRDII